MVSIRVIDIGIFMFFVAICLEHDGYAFEGVQYYEDEPDSVEKVLVAEYTIRNWDNMCRD